MDFEMKMQHVSASIQGRAVGKLTEMFITNRRITSTQFNSLFSQTLCLRGDGPASVCLASDLLDVPEG
jgi:hypothetical protein